MGAIDVLLWSTLHAAPRTSRTDEGDAQPRWHDRGASVDPTVDAPLADAESVSRIRAGDTTAFEMLYRAHAAALATFANRFIRAPDVAEEVVGDVFVSVWERRATFAPVAGVRAYLYAAVRHRALNVIRATHREAERYRIIAEDSRTFSDESTVTVDDAFDRDRRIADVQRIIATFPVLRRHVMYLRWGDGLTNAEIAAVLGLTDQAVRSHVSRALRDLRAALPELIR